jgi:hypothetical protein
MTMFQITGMTSWLGNFSPESDQHLKNCQSTIVVDMIKAHPLASVHSMRHFILLHFFPLADIIAFSGENIYGLFAYRLMSFNTILMILPSGIKAASLVTGKRRLGSQIHWFEISWKNRDR